VRSDNPVCRLRAPEAARYLAIPRARLTIGVRRGEDRRACSWGQKLVGHGVANVGPMDNCTRRNCARGRLPLKQADVTRALRGAVAAGVEIARVEIDPRAGSIVILTPRDFSTPVAAYDVWKGKKNAR
jgi:hypothetical protein